MRRAISIWPISGGCTAFLGSEAGGDRAAIIYTVLRSAKLNGLDPEAYLADFIDREGS